MRSFRGHISFKQLLAKFILLIYDYVCLKHTMFLFVATFDVVRCSILCFMTSIEILEIRDQRWTSLTYLSPPPSFLESPLSFFPLPQNIWERMSRGVIYDFFREFLKKAYKRTFTLIFVYRRPTFYVFILVFVSCN